MAYTGQMLFDTTVDLINKRLPNGTINATTTAIYKARALGLITSWKNQRELELGLTLSDPMQDLSEQITVNDRLSGAYYLAAHLLLVEDPASASFFNEKFEEMRKLVNKKQPKAIIQTTDIYGLSDMSEV